MLSISWHNPHVTNDAKRTSLPSERSLPAPPAQLRGADLSRERLLQATHELLLENGGAEPSVSQICGRAGMQLGMVSYCFGGKAQLLDALLRRGASEASRELEELVAADLSATQKLRRHIRGMIRNFVRYPYAQRLGEQVAANNAQSHAWAEIFATPALALYRKLVADGIASGEFRPDVDAGLLFFSSVGMCEFLFAAKSWLSLAGEVLDDALLDRFADHTVALLLQGVTAQPTPAPAAPSRHRRPSP
jgi:AcrR family transcriptional regulator